VSPCGRFIGASMEWVASAAFGPIISWLVHNPLRRRLRSLAVVHNIAVSHDADPTGKPAFLAMCICGVARHGVLRLQPTRWSVRQCSCQDCGGAPAVPFAAATSAAAV
jgi:hypothetical protein